MIPDLMIKLLTATVTILIAAVIGLGYVAFFSETRDKVHTQDLNRDMVSIIIRNHASELLVSAGITIDNANEMYEVYEELPGAKCFWEGMDYYPNVYEFDYPFVTWNYVGTRDIWLITSTENHCDKKVENWTIDDNTGEITYGRPDYDLYDDASGSQPPSSEDICASAENKWNEWIRAYPGEIEEKVGWDIRVELFKIQFEHACYK